MYLSRGENQESRDFDMSKRKASVSSMDIERKKKPMYKRPSTMGSAIGEELKFNDASFNTDATTTPTVVDLNNFAAGDTAITRDGNRIMMRSVELRVRYQLEVITTNALMRFVVLIDKNANGAAPTWLNVFDTATIESQRLVGNLSRYVILMDKVVPLNQSASNAGGVQKGFFKKYIKIKLPEIQLCSFGLSTASVPISNSLSLMYISDIAAGTADVDVSGTARLRFVG